MFPPISDDIDYLFLLREHKDDRITVFVPWKDSYYITRDELALYLERLKVDPVVVDGITNYLWNFYSLHVDIPSGDFVWLSEEDLLRLARDNSLENNSEQRQFARTY